MTVLGASSTLARRPHRAIGVMFASREIAEIDERALTYYLPTEPRLRAIRFAHEPLCADGLARFLEIEPRRMGGGRDEIGEHLRERSADSSGIDGDAGLVDLIGYCLAPGSADALRIACGVPTKV